jgi:hypothetical protein
MEIPNFPNKYSNICFLSETNSDSLTVYRLKENVESIS